MDKPIHNWSQALSQLAIYFEGRLDSLYTIRIQRILQAIKRPLSRPKYLICMELVRRVELPTS